MVFVGVLTSYKVLWRGKPDENGIHHPMQAVAFEDYGQDDPRPKIGDGYTALESLETNFTIEDLEPFTEYQFLVSSANSVGTTESSWETGRTLEGSKTSKIIESTFLFINILCFVIHY